MHPFTLGLPGGHGFRWSPQMGAEVLALIRVSPHPHPQTFLESLKNSFVPRLLSLGCFHYFSIQETLTAICRRKSMGVTVDSCRGQPEGWHFPSAKSCSFLASSLGRSPWNDSEKWELMSGWRERRLVPQNWDYSTYN